jgi:hypothetical protein
LEESAYMCMYSSRFVASYMCYLTCANHQIFTQSDVLVYACFHCICLVRMMRVVPEISIHDQVGEDTMCHVLTWPCDLLLCHVCRIDFLECFVLEFGEREGRCVILAYSGALIFLQKRSRPASTRDMAHLTVSCSQITDMSCNMRKRSQPLVMFTCTRWACLGAYTFGMPRCIHCPCRLGLGAFPIRGAYAEIQLHSGSLKIAFTLAN